MMRAKEVDYMEVIVKRVVSKMTIVDHVCCNPCE